MNIKQLFDPSKNIHRSIEKVITYGVSQEARLRSEISEYVVTDSIDEQFENLLLKMEAAMDVGGENEVGVWVSGFYGSGKSSFTKYLGLAFDDNIKIDGVPFFQHLQDRLKRQSTKALLMSTESAIISQASVAYKIEQPRPLWAQQWPQVWLAAVYESVASAVSRSSVPASEIKAICVSSLYGGSGIAVDENIKALHPCLIWMDRRAQAEVEWVLRIPR